MEKSNVFVGGAVLAAFVSSLCCVLPLIAVIFGLGAFGTAAIFESVRYPMIACSIRGLGVWFLSSLFSTRGLCRGRGLCDKAC